MSALLGNLTTSGMIEFKRNQPSGNTRNYLFAYQHRGHLVFRIPWPRGWEFPSARCYYNFALALLFVCTASLVSCFLIS